MLICVVNLALTGYLYYDKYKKVEPTIHQPPETDDAVMYAKEQKEKEEGVYEEPDEITYYTPDDGILAAEESYEKER
jgi:hypothetical protein